MPHQASIDVKPNFSIKIKLHCLLKCDNICDELTPEDLDIPNDLKSHQEYYDIITLAHIRHAVKCKYKIPEMCQKQIFHNRYPVLDDSVPLSKFLYIPSDRLVVLYYRTVKVDIMDEFLEKLHFLVETCLFISPSNYNNVELMRIICKSIRKNRDLVPDIAAKVFRASGHMVAQFSKAYFAKKGGLYNLFDLLKWTIQMGHMDRSLELISRLEYHVFQALGDFGQTFEERLMLMKSGYTEKAVLIQTGRISLNTFDHSVDYTEMLIEFPQTKELMVNHPKSIYNLAIHLKSKLKRYLMPHNRFPSAVILCRLSYAVESHHIFTDEKVFGILFGILKEISSDFSYLIYLLLQIFMNLMINPKIPKFLPEHLDTMQRVMENFPKEDKWVQLHIYERKNKYNYTTMVPFVHTLFVPKHCQVYATPELFHAYLQVAMMSLRNMLHMQCNQHLFIEQQLEDFLLIASWYLPQTCQEELAVVMEFVEPKVPSLQNIAMSRISVERDGFYPIYTYFTA